jgi:PPOX class probable F420-dependent enzyme
METCATATIRMAVLPESHRDLIDGPYWAALTTVMPDGQPQSTPVWCNREGDYVLTNTMRGFRKERNMRANPHVTLLVYDPRDPPRNIEVRGLVVAMSEAGAVEHDDRLAQLYLGQPGARFFGDAVPAALAQTHVPVKVTIAPIHVRVGEPAPSASLRASSGRPEDARLVPAAVPIALPVPVPDSHRDLLVRPVHGILSTMMPDGQPQASLVWVDYDGVYILLNTALGRQKCRNMHANARVTLLVVDPNQTDRWIELRGQVAAITPDGAIPHADVLAQRYLGQPHFYGDVYPAEWQHYETRVIVKIAPVKVSLDAIFR